MGTDVQALVERYRSARYDDTVAVLEGFHSLKHAVRFGAEILDARAADPEGVLALARALAPDLVSGDHAGAGDAAGPADTSDSRDPATAPALPRLLTPVERATYARLSPSAHPTGVIALARRPPADVDALLRRSPDGDAPVVFLDRPAHHGNIGAVVRVAAAADAAAVLVSGMHDPWHPSSIRGAAGLQLALPVARVDSLPPTDRPIVALDPEGEPLGGAGVPAGAVLVFGTEREGVSEELLARADQRVAIPMREGVSSLNLATAVAVVVYLRKQARNWPDPHQ